MITLTGLSPRQRDLADQVWSMDSFQLKSFIRSLDPPTRRDASLVVELMLWAVLDEDTSTHLARLELDKFQL